MGDPGEHQPGGVRRLPRHDDPVRRLPVDPGELPVDVRGDDVVGAQRLHHRVRRTAHPRRSAGRPHRQTADVPRRCGGVHRGLDALRYRPDGGLLIAARILQAVGAAALVPASLAMVLQTFSREKVPVAIAIWGAFGAVAGAAGPTLGALVVEHLGWRWAFYINLPVGIVSFVLGWRVLPEGKEANPGRLPDALRASACSSAGWPSPPTASSTPRTGAGRARRSCSPSWSPWPSWSRSSCAAVG